MGLVFVYTYICHTNQPNVGKYTIASMGVVALYLPEWLILMVKVGIETNNNKQSEFPTKGQDFIFTGIVRSPNFVGNQTNSTCTTCICEFKGICPRESVLFWLLISYTDPYPSWLPVSRKNAKTSQSLDKSGLKCHSSSLKDLFGPHAKIPNFNKGIKVNWLVRTTPHLVTH